MNGIPNSKLNGYFPVQRAVIEGNTIVDCKHGLLLGYNDDSKAKVAPADCVFRNNQIVSGNGQTAIEVRKLPVNSLFERNLVQSKKLGIDKQPGIELVSHLKIVAPTSLTKQDVGPK